METLLDRHLATFDEWLRTQFMYFSASPPPYHYLTVITLLDQLDLKGYNSERVSSILQYRLLPTDSQFDLLGGIRTDIEFSPILSTFLMDRERARSFWVNSQSYADLARYIVLELLRDT
jgi:hypothetical protein